MANGDGAENIVGFEVEQQILRSLKGSHVPRFPFGDPQTDGGLRQRLWMDPTPPRQHRPDLPPWLQEVILRRLAPEAVGRYPSAAHLAGELANPEQIRVTERGKSSKGTSWRVHFKRWIKAVGMCYKASPLPTVQIDEVPIVMVAVPFKDATDATHYPLRTAAQRSLGSRPGARLACVAVISPSDTSGTEAAKSEASVHTRYLELLRHWAQGIDTEKHQLSLHVLESGDVAQALLDYPRGNHVNVIVMGAATHGLALQRIAQTVPMKVAMDAPSTVILVKAELPFSALAEVRAA